jgi:hypothetical protein
MFDFSKSEHDMRYILQHYFNSTFQQTNSIFLSQQISINQISAKQTVFCGSEGVLYQWYIPWDVG